MSPRRTVAPRRRQKLVALHHQVYLTLRNELIRGHYVGEDGRVASALPAENDLAAEFKVSRVTIRRALAALEQEGLVVRRHGAGTFPAPLAAHLRRARDVESLYDDLNELMGSYEREVLAFGRTKTPAFVRNQVEDFGADCVYLSVLSKDGDAPVHLNFQYVPGRYAQLLEPLPRGDGRLLLLLLLQDEGVRSSTIDLNISSTAADLATSTRLDVQVGMPLIAMRRISRDATGAPLEYFEALTRPDRFSYSFRFGDRSR
jgi:GntR family transcriptional regulator